MLKKILMILLVVLFVGSFIKTIAIAICILILLILFLGKQLKLYNDEKIFYLFIPIFLGFFWGIYNDFFLVFKDVYYLIIPIFFIFLGFNLYELIPIRYFFKLIIWSGIITTIIRLFLSISYSGLGVLTNPYESRYFFGTIYGTPAAVVSVCILFFLRVFRLELYNRKLDILFFVINLVGVYMVASRTYWLMVMLFVAVYILYFFRKKIYVLVIACFFLFLALSSFLHDFGGANSSESTFFDKALNSFSEIRQNNYTDEGEINASYRGYESYMAYKTFLEGAIPEMAFGSLGKLIDLNTYVKLGETDMRYIPILHNGYYYLLVKTGILGLIVYSFFFLRIFFKNMKIFLTQSLSDENSYLVGILSGLLLALLITNYIVTSFFNLEMVVLLIPTGYILAYLNNERLFSESSYV